MICLSMHALTLIEACPVAVSLVLATPAHGCLWQGTHQPQHHRRSQSHLVCLSPGEQHNRLCMHAKRNSAACPLALSACQAAEMAIVSLQYFLSELPLTRNPSHMPRHRHWQLCYILNLWCMFCPQGACHLLRPPDEKPDNILPRHLC